MAQHVNKEEMIALMRANEEYGTVFLESGSSVMLTDRLRNDYLFIAKEHCTLDPTLAIMFQHVEDGYEAEPVVDPNIEMLRMDSVTMATEDFIKTMEDGMPKGMINPELEEQAKRFNILTRKPSDLSHLMGCRQQRNLQ